MIGELYPDEFENFPRLDGIEQNRACENCDLRDCCLRHSLREDGTFPYWKQPNSRGTFETSELNQKLVNYFLDLLDEAYQKGIKRGKELQLAECERRVNEIIKNLHKQEECGSNE